MRQFEEAAAAFRVALAAEPYNVSAAYNLGVALTRAGKREEGQEAMARFQKLRDSAYKSALGSNYLEQGKYAEALASTGAEPEAVDPKAPAVSLVEKAEALRRRRDPRPGGPRRRRRPRRGGGGEGRAAPAAGRGDAASPT